MTRTTATAAAPGDFLSRASHMTLIARVVEWLRVRGRPASTSQITAAFEAVRSESGKPIKSARISSILDKRAGTRAGDVARVPGGWAWVPPAERAPAAHRAEPSAAAFIRERRALAAARKRVPADLPPSAARVNRGAPEFAEALPRTFMPTGVYTPPARPIRAGALDYRFVPSRTGDQLVPFQARPLMGARFAREKGE